MARTTQSGQGADPRTPRALTLERSIAVSVATRQSRDASKAFQLRWTLCAGRNYNPTAVDHLPLRVRLEGTGGASGTRSARRDERWSPVSNGRPRRSRFFDKTVKTGT